MNATELKKIHAEYRVSLEHARDESMPDEARAKAGADAIRMREALDDAIIEVEEARELEAAVSAAEAREAATRSLSAIEPADPNRGCPVDAIRALARGEERSIAPTMLETRTDITNEASTTYGSYLVPQTWASEVVNFQIAGSGVLRAGPTILNTASGNQLNMPILVTDATALAGAEGVASTQSHPVWGTAPLNAYRFDLHFSVSDEILADSGVNIPALLRVYAGRAIAAKVNPYFADPDVGTGSSTIAAIQIGATHGKTAAAYTAVTIDELKELKYSVLPEYRMSGAAAWVGNSAVTLSTALARDDNGAFFWQPSAAADEPDTLFGHPWYEDAYMDSLATGNEPVVFGSVRDAYVVRYGMGGMEFSASRDFAFTSHEITFRAAIWVDAVTVDTLAVKTIILP